MRVLVIQHVPFEGPGALEPWFASRGDVVRKVHPYAGESLPTVEDFDWLVSMGGPMSVNDDAQHPWIMQECALIREAVANRRIVLGICLGAQMIAKSLGAPVYRNTHPEIGWFPIRATAEGIAFGLPPSATVFHWHGETFDLPKGARLLASSAGCAHQAFSIGESVLGLQCHPEATEDTVRQLVENCGDELRPGPYVMPAAAMLADKGRFAEGAAVTARLATRLARSITP